MFACPIGFYSASPLFVKSVALDETTVDIFDDGRGNTSRDGSTGDGGISALRLTNEQYSTKINDDKEENRTKMMLRGSKSGDSTGIAQIPPIPPFHPHHDGSVHYSSIMNNGVVSYRREINAPCDYGMLIFTVGVANKELPYEYELYNEAYLWSDNAGLCILYPTYQGYQVSNEPFWKLGVDPETVTFTNLIADPSSMHRVSSRELKVQNPTISGIDKSKLGDYVILARHNFYDVNYYKQLKRFINSWKTLEGKLHVFALE